MRGMRTIGLRQRARLKRTAIHLLPQFESQTDLETPVRIQPARHLPEGGIAKRSIRRTGRILTAFELFLLLSFASAVNLPLFPLYPATTRTGTKAVQQKTLSFRSGMGPPCENHDLVSARKNLAICWNNFGVLKGDDRLPNHP